VASPRLTRLADRRIDGWWALVLMLAVIAAIWAATLATCLAATGLHP